MNEHHDSSIMNLLRLLLFVLCWVCSVATAKPITISFWHSMAGQWGAYVKHIADRFNASQHHYRVVPVYKGSYAETLTSTVAAFRAGQAPTLVQIFEVGTATMITPQGAIVPAYKLLPQALDIFPAIKTYYSDNQNRLLAVPFNTSTAVLYYNRDAFKKAGLDPTKPPATWPQVASASKKLLTAGSQCGFTTTYPSWTQLEIFSAWHNLPLATLDNGFAGREAKLLFANRTVIHHIATLAKWQQQGIFQYGGRDDNASALFTSGRCAMMIESSGSIMALPKVLTFKLGVARLPYWPSVAGAPQNSILGGGAIWIMARHSNTEYQAAAAFLTFILTPTIQTYWQHQTGYLPVTKSGYEMAKSQGFYQRYPNALIPLRMLNLHPPKPYTRGLRLVNYTQIRRLNDEALERAWSASVPANKALLYAVKRGNVLLKR